MLIRLDWNGLLSAVTNGSGFVVEYMHDIMDWVTNISWHTTSGAAIGGFQYEYDAAGCIVSRSHAIGSNAFDRVYAYDALGRRVSTTTLEGTTRHVYDDSWQVVADLDEQDNVIASYTWGDGIDNLLAVKVGGSTCFPLTDIQGTVWGGVVGI